VSLSKPEIRVIISGGGTGGHIFPAIAIANALKQENAKNEILFVGAEGRMEMEKVPAAGYKIEGLPISGFQRKLSVQNLLLPIKILSSLAKARRIVKQFKPDAAVGVGGYASGPLLYAASALNIPCLIQEQNSYAGITNKLLSKRAKKVCVAYNGMEKYFPAEKIVLTGNPVRKDITKVIALRDDALRFFNLSEKKKTVLVIGGSLGARTLNESISLRLEKIIAAGVQVIWQTGKGYHLIAKESVAPYSDIGIMAFDFIQRMDLAYAAADVVVSRAGASSISELCIVGKPSVLVPSPNVSEDHQTKNAMALVNKNAALLVKDEDARRNLVNEVLLLLNNEAQQQVLASSISKLAMPDSASLIANEIYRLLEK
jgi:UDP-N-acetylglucosamine--N-acetylmuramyl-(pentapeptide) pyrophosphoryl-undecaprenol N-acetylglucosamine transferase